MLLRNHDQEMRSNSSDNLSITCGKWSAQDNGCAYDTDTCVKLKSVWPYLEAIANEDIPGAYSSFTVTKNAKQLQITESTIRTTSMVAALQFCSIRRLYILAKRKLIRYIKFVKKVDTFFQKIPKNRTRIHTAARHEYLKSYKQGNSNRIRRTINALMSLIFEDWAKAQLKFIAIRTNTPSSLSLSLCDEMVVMTDSESNEDSQIQAIQAESVVVSPPPDIIYEMADQSTLQPEMELDDGISANYAKVRTYILREGSCLQCDVMIICSINRKDLHVVYELMVNNGFLECKKRKYTIKDHSAGTSPGDFSSLVPRLMIPPIVQDQEETEMVDTPTPPIMSAVPVAQEETEEIVLQHRLFTRAVAIPLGQDVMDVSPINETSDNDTNRDPPLCWSTTTVENGFKAASKAASIPRQKEPVNVPSLCWSTTTVENGFKAASKAASIPRPQEPTTVDTKDRPFEDHQQKQQRVEAEAGDRIRRQMRVFIERRARARLLIQTTVRACLARRKFVLKRLLSQEQQSSRDQTPEIEEIQEAPAQAHINSHEEAEEDEELPATLPPPPELAEVEEEAVPVPAPLSMKSTLAQLKGLCTESGLISSGDKPKILLRLRKHARQIQMLPAPELEPAVDLDLDLPVEAVEDVEPPEPVEEKAEDDTPTATPPPHTPSPEEEARQMSPTHSPSLSPPREKALALRSVLNLPVEDAETPELAEEEAEEPPRPRAPALRSILKRGLTCADAEAEAHSSENSIDNSNENENENEDENKRGDEGKKVQKKEQSHSKKHRDLSLTVTGALRTPLVSPVTGSMTHHGRKRALKVPPLQQQQPEQPSKRRVRFSADVDVRLFTPPDAAPPAPVSPTNEMNEPRVTQQGSRALGALQALHASPSSPSLQSLPVGGQLSPPSPLSPEVEMEMEMEIEMGIEPQVLFQTGREALDSFQPGMELCSSEAQVAPMATEASMASKAPPPVLSSKEPSLQSYSLPLLPSESSDWIGQKGQKEQKEWVLSCQDQGPGNQSPDNQSSGQEIPSDSSTSSTESGTSSSLSDFASSDWAMDGFCSWAVLPHKPKATTTTTLSSDGAHVDQKGYKALSPKELSADTTTDKTGADTNGADVDIDTDEDDCWFADFQSVQRFA